MQTGDIYRHNKTGNLYTIVAVACDCEDPMQRYIVYQSHKDQRVWSRSEEDFTRIVELDRGPELPKEQVERFTKVGESLYSFQQYNALASASANPFRDLPDALKYAITGLGGEAGEVAHELVKLVELQLEYMSATAATGRVQDKLKKELYQREVKELSDKVKAYIEDEMGDWLWYANRVLNRIGSSLGAAAQRNLNKVQERFRGRFDPSYYLKKE